LQINSSKLKILFQHDKTGENTLKKALKYFYAAIKLKEGSDEKQLNLNEGYFKEYDSAQEAYSNATQELADYESSLKSSIPGLSIKEVSGEYTVEVSSKYSGKIPKDFKMSKELKVIYGNTV
jgi:hypothetical protein